MKVLLLLLVVALITCATTTSDDYSRSTEESSSSKENGSSSSDESDSSSSIESEECKISYKYTIWIGDNVDEVHSLNLQSKCGIVFLNAMQQASNKKPQFAFEYTTHPLFGAFVTEIDGVSNDDEANSYWMLYDLTTEPDENDKPDDEYLSPVGVSTLEVLDGHSYLFWYRTVTGSEDINEDY